MVYKVNTKNLSQKKRGFITGAAIATVTGGIVAGTNPNILNVDVAALKNMLKEGKPDQTDVKIADAASIEKAFDQEKFAQNAKLGYKTAGAPFGENPAEADVTACCCCCPCCSTAAAVTKESNTKQTIC